MTSLTLELDVQDLVHNMTIEALSKLIDSRLSFNGSAGDGDDTATGGSINLLEEVGTLDSSIFPAPTRNNGKPHLRYAECSIPPQRVFLTGATGFLGGERERDEIYMNNNTWFIVTQELYIETQTDNLCYKTSLFNFSTHSKRFTMLYACSSSRTCEVTSRSCGRG